MIADAVKSLIERGEPLLAVEHQKGVLRDGWRCTFELTAGEGSLPITHTQDAAGGVVVGNRDDQGLGGTWLPDKIALEIGQHHVAAVDPIQQIEQGLGVGVFVDGHSTYLCKPRGKDSPLGPKRRFSNQSLSS